MQVSQARWIGTALIVVAIAACGGKKTSNNDQQQNPYGNPYYGHVPNGGYPYGQGFPPLGGPGQVPGNGPVNTQPADLCEMFTFADGEGKAGQIKGLKEGIYVVSSLEEATSKRLDGKFLGVRKTKIKDSKFQYQLLTLTSEANLDPKGSNKYTLIEESYALKENRLYTEARLVADKEKSVCKLEVIEKSGGMESFVISGQAADGVKAIVEDVSSNGEKVKLVELTRLNDVKHIPKEKAKEEASDASSKESEKKEGADKDSDDASSSASNDKDQKKDQNQVSTMPIAQLAVVIGDQESINALTNTVSAVVQEGKVVERRSAQYDAKKDYCAPVISRFASEEIRTSGATFKVKDLIEEANVTHTARTIKIHTENDEVFLVCLKHGKDSFTLADFDRILGSVLKVVDLNKKEAKE